MTTGNTTRWVVLGLVAGLTVGCTGEITDDGIDWAEELSVDNPEVVVHADDVVGVRLPLLRAWKVARDPLLFDTHGFMVSETVGDDDHPHGELPVARVALDHGGRAADLEARLDAIEAEFPDVAMRRRQVVVGGRPGVAIGPVPGASASVAVLFAADDRLYRVHYYAPELDARGEALLAALEPVAPSAPVESLALRRADSPEGRYGQVSPEPNVPRGGDEPPAAPIAAEYRLSNGCWAAASGFFMQTTHSRDANGTGWSQMGTPNFWGERTHGNWGMGRCTSGFYTNDLYAIDYYVRVGDRLYSPFADGVVVYAGWDPYGWWNYGRMVVIRDMQGKYYSLSAHLSRINVRPGQRVDRDTLIGWGGSTGYAAPYPHVHQVYYRYPSLSYGRPYGGAGLMPTALRYLGQGGGVYTRFAKGKWASW
jgi:murein DD-endopeptidase MepM/ murein hydrolase activator NlpD